MDSLPAPAYAVAMSEGFSPTPLHVADSPDILDRLSVAVAVVDAANGRFRLFNQAFAQQFGAPPELFMDWWLAVHRDAPVAEVLSQEWRARVASLTDGGGFNFLESDMHSVSGQSLHVRTQIQRLGGNLVLCFLDLTDDDQRQVLLRQALAEMEARSTTDPLTGVLTRRRLEEASASEMHRFQRFGHPISLILADIDHFKQVNDQCGHLVGDRVLTEFARRLTGECRDLDVIGRYGGEEFVILLPSTPLAGAYTLAGKLRHAVYVTPFAEAGTLSASFGVAECLSGESWESWLSRADKALYKAKDSGRNRVMAAPESAFDDRSIKHRNRLDRLTWEEGHCVGDPVIDAQHRQLFSLANQLLHLIREAAPPADIHTTIRELIQATSRHFRDEEAILGALGYPRRDQHAKAHRILTAKLDAISSQSALGTLPNSRLIEFLAYDLVDHHALGADRDFIPWLRTGPREDLPASCDPEN